MLKEESGHFDPGSFRPWVISDWDVSDQFWGQVVLASPRSFGQIFLVGRFGPEPLCTSH